MIIPLGKHYLYCHIRLDKNTPFYIGIGTKSKKTVSMKKEYDRAYAKYGRSNLWKKIADKTPYEVEIMLESDDYEFIKQKEIEFIALYGRININTGILSNLTDGGEGSKGHVTSDKQRKEQSERMSKRTGSKNSASKPVIDTLTLEVFDCVKYAAAKHGVTHTTLSHYLSGKRPNLTYFVYLKDYVEGEIHYPDGKDLRIVDTETGEVFKGYYEAGRHFGIKHNKIRSIVDGKVKSSLKITYFDERLRPNPYDVLDNNGGKLVMCKETGIFFYTIREAAKAFNMNHQTLRSMLDENKKHTNKTSLIYV